MQYIGVDIGGSKIAAGVVTHKGELLSRHTVNLDGNEGSADVIKAISKAAEEACTGTSLQMGDILGIGIGVPGWVRRGRAERVCNLPQMNGLDLIFEISHRLGQITVEADNDANCAALAEYCFGGLKGAASGLMLTLGTGIGGGFIQNGSLYRGANGAACEVGHMRLYGGEGVLSCSCGKRGCFERYASARALCMFCEGETIAERGGALYDILTERLKNDGLSGGIKGYEAELAGPRLNAKEVFHAIREGDGPAIRGFERWKAALCDGVVSLADIFDPDVIVIGGGISSEGELISLPVKAAVDECTYLGKMGNIKVKTADLGNDAGVIGAAMLVHRVGESGK